MRFQDVKAALLPTVSNVDALYAAFVAESKSNDVEKFLVHLKDKGLVTDEQIRTILKKDPLSTGTLATQGPPKGGHLAGPTMTTEMMDEEDDEEPAAAPPPPAVPSHLKTTSSTPAPAQPRASTPTAPTPAAEAPAPAAPKAGTNPGSNAPSFKATGPGALRGTGPIANGKRTNPGAAPAPAAEGSAPSARTPSFPPKNQPGKNDGTPADIPGRGYKFVGKIGEGAMGEVLIAKDLDLHRTVAYKVMSESIRSQAALAGKFYGEAQITAQLDHPNIVPVYSLDRAPNGGLSYTMKLINGRTMEKLVEETRDQYKSKKIDDGHTLTTRLDQFLKVCDAIHYAHSRGVVHRDLKPENIMIGSYGEVYVMDWGISRLMEVQGADRDHLVLVEGYQDDEALKPKGEEDDDDEDDADDEDEGGVIIGTPSYMSPEQARGRKVLDGRSDQYALGLILYEVVGLKQAVTGKSPLKIVMRQRDAEKEPFVHAFGEVIAPEIKAIVDKATRKDPEQRYKDVHAMADDIRRYLRGEAVLARPDTTRQKVMRWVGRHRELTLFMVFVFFTFGAFTVFASVGWQLWASAQQRAHEQAMTQLLTSTGAQASVIDSYFARYEGQLGIVAASSAEMLMRGDITNDTIFLAKDFDTDGKQPPDFEESKRYGAKISVEHPVFQVPKGSNQDAAMLQFRRLTPIQRYLKRVLLLSHSEQASAYTPKRADRLIRDVGTPLAWATIGLADGGYIGFPGNGGYPDTFDARDRPWYKLAKDKREPTWGSPYIDSGGLGLLLPCSMSLYDEDDKFLAVASVQLPFDYIIAELLVTEGLPQGAESFLVDDTGHVVVRSSEKGKTFDTATLRNRGVRMPEFPVPEVVEMIKEKESGRVSVSENGQDDLVLYTRMNSLGWYYVVRGEESNLLAGH